MACQSGRVLPAAGFSEQDEEGGCVDPTEGAGPCPVLSIRSHKAQRSMYQLIIVNKVDLLFQPCHHSCVVFDVSEKIIRTLRTKRRPQEATPFNSWSQFSEAGSGVRGQRRAARKLFP